MMSFNIELVSKENPKRISYGTNGMAKEEINRMQMDSSISKMHRKTNEK